VSWLQHVPAYVWGGFAVAAVLHSVAAVGRAWSGVIMFAVAIRGTRPAERRSAIIKALHRPTGRRKPSVGTRMVRHARTLESEPIERAAQE
jgi:hypothetical protein